MKASGLQKVALAMLALVLIGSWSSAATMVGPLIQVNTGGAYWSEIRYNPYSDQCLALWVDVTDANGWQLKGRRIDPNTGNLLGSEFYVSPDPATYPALIGKAAYNSTNHEWFVVYQGTLVQYDDVVGQRIASDGTKVGGAIALVARNGYQNNGEAAYDPVNNRYLVIWREKPGSYAHVYGRFFDPNGGAVSSEFQIRDASAIYDSHSPKVAYNPIAQEFMVIWQDYRNYPGSGQDNEYSDIYGHRINANTMAKIGSSNLAIYWGGSPYVPNGQDIPGALVCNATEGRYAISIQKLTAADYYRTYGLIVNSDGSWYGPGVFQVSHPDNGVPTGLAHDPNSNTYVFTYEDLTNADNIRGKQFSASGAVIGSVFTANGLNGGTSRDGVLEVRPSDGQFLQIGVTDSGGVVYGQRFIMEADTFPPGNVDPLRAYRQSDTSVLLTWANPWDADFAGTMIRYRTDAYPTSIADGALVCNRTAAPGSSDSYTHAVTAGQTYCYTAFTYDSIPNYSTGAYAVPSYVWLNEPYDSYSNGALDGQGGWIKESAKNSCILQESVRVGSSGRAVEAFGSATVYDDATIANFGAITGGYHKVSFDMRRNAAASANQGFIGILQGSTIITRAYWSTNFNMLHGPGVSFTDLVTGPASGQWYHVEIGVNLTSGTLDAWVDGQQKVSGQPFYQSASQINTINITGYSAATTASYLDDLKGERIPTTVPPAAPTVTAPTLGSTVYTPYPRIAWSGDPHDSYEVHINTSNVATDGSSYDSGQVSSANNYHDAGPLAAGPTYYAFVRLRNGIGWGSWSAAGHWFGVVNDGTPPSAPANFNAMGSNGAIKLGWTNPSNSDLASVMIRVRTDGYPESQSDGTLVTNASGAPGAKMAYTEGGLTNGVKRFYSAFAYDHWGMYSAAATDFASPEPWAVEYHADALPSGSSPAWTILDDGGSESYSHIEPEGGILHILDTSTDWGTKIRWYRNWSASSTAGTTVITRARSDAVVPDAYASNVTLSDGVYYINFVIWPDRIGSKANATTTVDRQYLLDGTVYHKYRFTLKNGTYYCYVDENYAPVFTGPAYTITENRIYLGSNGSGTTQSVYYDYLCYRTDGAAAPVGGATDVSILAAKLSPNGASVRLLGNAVSAAFANYLYVQTPGGLHGLRVNMPSHGRSAGQAVSLVGLMATNSDGERCVYAESVLPAGSSGAYPIAMAGASLGGADLQYNPSTGAGQRGEDGGVGPNNVGLLVTTWGRVVSVDPSGQFFRIDDGSGPIKVMSGDLSEPVGEPYVIVTGIVTLDMSEGPAAAAIRPRIQDDMQVIAL